VQKKKTKKMGGGGDGTTKQNKPNKQKHNAQKRNKERKHQCEKKTNNKYTIVLQNYHERRQPLKKLGFVRNNRREEKEDGRAGRKVQMHE
jgi:hypothetical protein